MDCPTHEMHATKCPTNTNDFTGVINQLSRLYKCLPFAVNQVPGLVWGRSFSIFWLMSTQMCTGRDKHTSPCQEIKTHFYIL